VRRGRKRPTQAHTIQSSNPIGLAAEITQFLAAVNEPKLTEDENF
jgi:hypothetical protein